MPFGYSVVEPDITSMGIHRNFFRFNRLVPVGAKHPLIGATCKVSHLFGMLRPYDHRCGNTLNLTKLVLTTLFFYSLNTNLPVKQIAHKKTGHATGLFVLEKDQASAMVFLIITERRRTPSRMVSGLAAEKLSRIVFLGPLFG